MANYLDGLVIIVREKFVCFCFRRIMMMIFCTGVRERERMICMQILLLQHSPLFAQAKDHKVIWVGGLEACGYPSIDWKIQGRHGPYSDSGHSGAKSS